MNIKPYDGMTLTVDDGLGTRCRYVWTSTAPKGYDPQVHAAPDKNGLYKVLEKIETYDLPKTAGLSVEHIRFLGDPQ